MDEEDIIDNILNFRILNSLPVSFHIENLPNHCSGIIRGAFRYAKTATLVKRTNYMMINEEGDCGWVTVRSWVANRNRPSKAEREIPLAIFAAAAFFLLVHYFAH